MAEEGLKNTDHKKIFIGKPKTFNKEEIFFLLESLKEAAFNEREEDMDPIMRKLVTTYIRPEDVNESYI